MAPMHSFAFSILILASAAATQSPITLPADAVGRDGLGVGHLAGVTQGRRQQFILGEGLLVALRGHVIERLTFRRDGQPARLTGGQATLRVLVSQGVLQSPSQASPDFATNLGVTPTLVFQGQVALPNSPPPTDRNSVGFGPGEVIDIALAPPFSYVGGTLCLDIAGEPVTGSASPAWPIDVDRSNLRGVVSVIGRACVRTAEQVTRKISADPAFLRAGTTARFMGFAEAGDFGALLLAAQRLGAPMNLGFLGASNCDLWVLPDVTLMVLATASSRGPLAAMNTMVHIPHEGAFVGSTLHSQWLVFQRDGLRTSEAMTVTLAPGLPSIDASIVLSTPMRGATMPVVGEVEVGALPVMRIEHR